MFKWKDALFMILTLFLLFFLDGWLASTFHSAFYSQNFIMIPRLLLLGLIIYSLYVPVDVMSVLALFFGFIYDSYYIGILGVHMAAFLIAVTVVYILRINFRHSILESGLLSMIVLVIFELVLYAITYTINVVTVSLPMVFVSRIGPTIVLNALFYFILYPPLTKKFKVQERKEKLRQLEEGEYDDSIQI